MTQGPEQAPKRLSDDNDHVLAVGKLSGKLIIEPSTQISALSCDTSHKGIY